MLWWWTGELSHSQSGQQQQQQKRWGICWTVARWHTDLLVKHLHSGLVSREGGVYGGGQTSRMVSQSVWGPEPPDNPAPQVIPETIFQQQWHRWQPVGTSGVGAGAAADRRTEEEACYVTAERGQGASLLEGRRRGGLPWCPGQLIWWCVWKMDIGDSIAAPLWVWHCLDNVLSTVEIYDKHHRWSLLSSLTYKIITHPYCTLITPLVNSVNMWEQLEEV